MNHQPSLPLRLAFAATLVTIVAAHWAVAQMAETAGGTSLQDAVMAGKDIRAALDLSLCTAHDSGAPGPAIRASVHPNALLLMKDGTVAFSDTHLSVHPDGKSVREFVSYRVRPDGRVEFQTSVLDAPDLSVTQTRQYDCALGKGLRLVW